jgi:hypothetical protein
MKGISPFISILLVVVISFSALTLVVTTILPTIEKTRDSLIVDDALKNLDLMDSILKELVSEYQGSKRSITINVPAGANYIFDSTTNTLIFEYTPKQSLDLGGKMGSKFIEQSLKFSDYFNNYTEGENASSVWNIISGTWNVTNSEYHGINGTVWKYIGNLNNFEISAKIRNISSLAGEVYPLTVSPQNLVAYYTFDEASGNKTYDYSGNNNDGTLYNGSTICSGQDCPNWVDGKFGKALQFDGSNDFVEVIDSNSLKPTNQITICSWFKFKSDTTQVYDPIVEKPDEGRVGYGLLINKDTNKLTFYLNTTDYYGAEAGPTVNPNVWYFACGSWDGSTAIIYLNGENVYSRSHTGSLNLDTSSLFIGKWSSHYFNGTIDEVKIFNKSLSESEIKAEYQLGLLKLKSTGTTSKFSSTNPTNLYLALSSPSGETAFDNIRVRTSEKNIKIIIPYNKIKFQNTFRVGPGNQNIVITHNGTSQGKVLISISSG